MKLSNKSFYAVRALFWMAYHSPAGNTKVTRIAESEGISAGFLDQIFQSLRKAEILVSQRGPKGGYLLARPLDQITIGQIVRVIEGETEDHFCRDLKALCEQEEAPPGLCVTADIWKQVAGEIDQILDSFTLSDLVQRGEEVGLSRESFEGFIYII